MFNLPWFMDLTFQVPIQYFSLQHHILLSPPNTTTTKHHFCFGPATLFCLELLVVVICSSMLDTCQPGGLIFWCHIFCLFIQFIGFSLGKYSGVVCHFLLQWITFFQNSPLWPIYLGWTCMTWLIASLRYTSLFTTTRQSPIKWVLSCSVVSNSLWPHGL